MNQQVPLLQTQGLVLRGETPLEVGNLSVEGESLALWNDASALLPALAEPERIAEGSLFILGQPAEHSLQSGIAAYVPSRLPLPPETKVKDALLLSARLLGLGRSEVQESLGRTRLSTHEGRKLGELSRLQSRLVSLAHGLLGHPQLLLLENLYADLDEADAAIIETVLDIELAERASIAATSVDDPESRSLAMNAQSVLIAAGNTIVPLSDPSALMSDGHWVTCTDDATPLARGLRDLGALVTQSPRTSVLFVRQATGSAIYRAANEAGLSIIELAPATTGGSGRSRAKSDA